MFRKVAVMSTCSLTGVLALAACESPNNTVELEDRVLRHLESLDQRQYSGTWTYSEGSRYCDGYLTRKSSDDYCVADPPSDWEAFEFDGNTYYRQPLGSL